MTTENEEQEQPSKWRWIIIAALTLLAAIVVFRGAGMIAAARDRAQPAREETLPLVETVTAEAVPEAFTVVEEGFLRPRAEIDVVAEVSGKVVEVAPQLEPGGRFEKGELLFRIDPRTFEAELERAKADLSAARADLERARSEASRQDRLSEIGAAATARLEQANASLASAKARVGQAEAALTVAEKRLEDTTVSAPFDAAVISENVALGRFVQPGQSTATIFDTGAAEVVLGLLPVDAAAVRLAAQNTEGPLEVAVAPSRASASAITLVGQVKRFGQSVDRQSRTVPVVVEVPRAFSLENDAAVFANDFVEVTLPARSAQELYAAPLGVVREERFVWVLDDENRMVSVAVTPVQRKGSTVVFRTAEDLGGRALVLTSLTEEAAGIKVAVAEDNAQDETLQ